MTECQTTVNTNRYYDEQSRFTSASEEFETLVDENYLAMRKECEDGNVHNSLNVFMEHEGEADATLAALLAVFTQNRDSISRLDAYDHLARSFLLKAARIYTKTENPELAEQAGE